MWHGCGNHFLALRWRMELVRNPWVHFPTCNKLVANQYQSWKTTFVLVLLMRISEVRLHLLSSIFKLVVMSISEWLSTLKHIETPTKLSWKISRNGICMEFFKPSTWCKYFVVYAVVFENVKCLHIFCAICAKKKRHYVHFHHLGRAWIKLKEITWLLSP